MSHQQEPGMDVRSQRDLSLLNSIAEGQQLTQRTLSRQVGIALGLTNIYLKRFVRKGYVKCVNVQANRILYLLTPKGIAEKTRLTYEFWEYSLNLYQEVREHLRSVLRVSLASGVHRVAIYGTGEAAELAYLCLREVGLEPVAIFDEATDGTFLGMPIYRLADHARTPFDRMLVATLDDPEELVGRLITHGVRPEHLLMLREMPGNSSGARSG